MPSENLAHPPDTAPLELDARYGKIGISAVAAAIRYQGEARNPAYAPAVAQTDERFLEAAA